MTDEELEPQLEQFARTALLLAKNGVYETTLATDNDLKILVTITPYTEPVEQTKGGTHE